ncbi:MAG: ABC transporter permease [Alkalispirochaeta sp.]
MNREAFVEAFHLLLSLDRELVLITFNSLRFALASTVIASIIATPLGVAIALREFRGKRFLVSTAHTLMGLPTVVVGLLVFSLLSRSGPLGGLGLLFSPAAVIIGQSVLALPIVFSLVYSGLSRLDPELRETLLTLGASPLQRTTKIIQEGRIAVASAILTAFGRVVGEVGTAMMLGGNIRWYTRTITTAIALETQKGAFALSVALGVVLLIVAFGVNFGLNYLIRFRGSVA